MYTYIFFLLFITYQKVHTNKKRYLYMDAVWLTWDTKGSRKCIVFFIFYILDKYTLIKNVIYDW